MDNGPAKKNKTNERLQCAGDKIGDPFEVSTIRREDFSSYKGIMEGDDVIQSLSKPSVQVSRGHQGTIIYNYPRKLFKTFLIFHLNKQLIEFS